MLDDGPVEAQLLVERGLGGRVIGVAEMTAAGLPGKRCIR